MDCIVMLVSVKTVTGHKVRVGGEQHSGWLPESASRPLATPVRDLLFDLEIQFDGFGYLLCYASQNGELNGDTWHKTLQEAEDVALEEFRVRYEQWQESNQGSAPLL
jgi:hypothetical protein